MLSGSKSSSQPLWSNSLFKSEVQIAGEMAQRTRVQLPVVKQGGSQPEDPMTSEDTCMQMAQTFKNTYNLKLNL